MKGRLFEVGAPPAFVLLWSSAFIAGIIGVGAAPPMTLLFCRFVIAGALLACYVRLSGAQWPRGRVLVHTAIAGLLIQLVQFAGFYTAMREHVTAAVIALVQGLNPVLIALLAGPILGERVSRRQWLGFGIGGAGVALAIVDRAAGTASGFALCVVGLLGLSLGTMYQKRFTSTVDPRATTAVHNLASAPVALVFALAGGDLHVDRPGPFAGALTWMVLINAMAAFLLLNAMLRRWTTSRVGKLFFATPAVTTVMAWLTVGQTPHPLTLAGLAVGLVGMTLASTVVAPAAAPERIEAASVPE
jgi:drug/metabolite transporter (DMT)-like permease